MSGSGFSKGDALVNGLVAMPADISLLTATLTRKANSTPLLCKFGVKVPHFFDEKGSEQKILI